MINDGTYIVSGGSKGLGLDICEYLLKNNLKVATFARHATSDTERLTTEYAGNFIFKEIDILDTDNLAAFINYANSTLGPIVGLVNNAAVGQDDLLLHMSIAKAAEIIQINTLGTVMLTKLVLKKIILSGGGSVVFISSICANKGYPGLSVYSGTKGFIESFCKSLVVEFRKTDVFFNIIEPGFFESEMSSVLSQEQIKRIKNNAPSGKLTSSLDVVKALNLILTSNNLNGSVIVIDGGTSS